MIILNYWLCEWELLLWYKNYSTAFTTPNTATASPVSILNLNYCSYCSNINYYNIYWYSSISRKTRTNNSSRAEPIDYFNQLWINTISNEILHQNISHQFTIGELYNYITLIIIIGIISIPYIKCIGAQIGHLSMIALTR